ncbi:MAG: tyrosine-type recombinase/integrase [Planctomycetota bacterium]|jgi:integrase/recombinase XerD
MTTRALEDQEIKAIFEHIEGTHAKRNETLLITGIGLALRASELVGLKVSDVYDKKVKSYVTIRPETAKFGKERTIRIGDGIQDTIADFLDWKRQNKESCAKKAPLFVSQKSGHLTRQALFEIIKRIFREAGIEQSPHCLRKTGATIYYIESDYDLIATQHFLGHSDPSTTRKYIGLTSEQIVEYAERMSNHLFGAIREGKFNSNQQMSHLNLEMALKFLTAQGFEVSLTMKDEAKRAKVIPFPMRA